MAAESPPQRLALLSVLADREVTVPAAAPGERVITPDELKAWIRSGQVLRHLLAYPRVRLLASDVRYVQRPLRAAVALRALSRGSVWFESHQGQRERIGWLKLAGLAASAARDLATVRAVLRRVPARIAALSAAPAAASTDLTGRPVYLKTDLVFAIQAGGSVAHTAGVLNHLDRFVGPPKFLTTAPIPTVRPDIDTTLLVPSRRYWDFIGLPPLLFSEQAVAQSMQALVGLRPSFVYQRYSAANFTGLELSRALGVPLVLEFNGSEIWVSRHWGKPLPYEDLCERIEVANLRGAHLVVVVSEPIKDELVSRGIPAGRILVNPNGVDTATYNPNVDGSKVRHRLGLGGKTVIGFIGTFGRWHGAEVLVDAFAALLRARPEFRDQVQLLLVGDGQRMPDVRKSIVTHALDDVVVVTGLVPQVDGPAHLAACDIFASPHVPNPDGTRFFGSPTKLFEYMAMGRGIVASDLDQIGETLEHRKTAWLVEPGSVAALADGLQVLLDDPALREELGARARQVATARHSWEAHTRAIIDRLIEITS